MEDTTPKTENGPEAYGPQRLDEKPRATIWDEIVEEAKTLLEERDALKKALLAERVGWEDPRIVFETHTDDDVFEAVFAAARRHAGPQLPRGVYIEGSGRATEVSYGDFTLSLEVAPWVTDKSYYVHVSARTSRGQFVVGLSREFSADPLHRGPYVSMRSVVNGCVADIFQSLDRSLWLLLETEP